MINIENILLLNNLEKREIDHSKRVANYAVNFGKVLGLKYEQQKLLYSLGLLHDIGKGKISNEILSKREPLTKLERKIIESHSVFGEKYILLIPELKAYSKVIRAHHERWDGNGYPDGLCGENIPFFSRVISLVDVYDALTMKRPYRDKVFTTKEALGIIKESCGQFDPYLAEIFIQNAGYIKGLPKKVV
ncbi:HD-GYP domain-containing protein [Paramaledivibacter caminithermalis]|jgi:putative nucleotidyltransferase with HDIG domain|uniref:HDIG domain-containing protein n=1 Tax=Paramaledivibacter caminithermalis (strain DSM 15212 / CIP 107654 / DViRD3) TaxID=1121301 RepID=A0A1M6TYV0_PARC5|nr:HD domain-containing phosphohydrolase [Paramaledivibacter caminithermalis]SHK62091.1 HDIG domain-containing protein [Paramaledivibacter caminithermalis DSM 15212]